MASKLIGIIPAAGSGVRARPYTYEVHKGMFEIDGIPNITRLIATMRDELHIEEIVIVLGYMGDMIQQHFGDGNEQNVRLHYINNEHLDKGWAWSVMLAKSFLAGRHGCVMLCDEFYLDTNLAELVSFPYEKFTAVCTVKTVSDESLIKKNFSVERIEERVVRLVENPVTVPNDTLGMATFILSPEFFELLESAYDEGRPSVEFVNFIDELIRGGASVGAFDMTGEYINLNDVVSLEAAQDLAIRHRLQNI